MIATHSVHHCYFRVTAAPQEQMKPIKITVSLNWLPRILQRRANVPDKEAKRDGPGPSPLYNFLA